jgi:hypothetical protein
MTEAELEPLFTVSNHHSPEAGQPPALKGDTPHLYHSYFENMFGEQSIFVYDWQTRQAVLWSGDAGWQPYPVVNGQVPDLKLREEELTWLRACWQAIRGSRKT